MVKFLRTAVEETFHKYKTLVLMFSFFFYAKDMKSISK